MCFIESIVLLVHFSQILALGDFVIPLPFGSISINKGDDGTTKVGLNNGLNISGNGAQSGMTFTSKNGSLTTQSESVWERRLKICLSLYFSGRRDSCWRQGIWHKLYLRCGQVQGPYGRHGLEARRQKWHRPGMCMRVGSVRVFLLIVLCFREVWAKKIHSSTNSRNWSSERSRSASRSGSSDGETNALKF